MTNNAPFTGQQHEHSESLAACLRDSALRDVNWAVPEHTARLWPIGKTVREVVYGNYADVLTWDEVGQMVGDDEPQT